MTHIRTNSFEPRHSAPVQPSTSCATPKVTADRINTNRLQHSAALTAPRLEAKLLLQAWPCQHTRHWSFRQLAAQDLCLTSKGWQEVQKRVEKWHACHWTFYSKRLRYFLLSRFGLLLEFPNRKRPKQKEVLQKSHMTWALTHGWLRAQHDPNPLESISQCHHILQRPWINGLWRCLFVELGGFLRSTHWNLSGLKSSHVETRDLSVNVMKDFVELKLKHIKTCKRCYKPPETVFHMAGSRPSRRVYDTSNIPQDLQSQSVHPHAGALLTARAASSAQGMAKIIRSHVEVKTVAIRTKHLQILEGFQLHRKRGCINLDNRYLTVSPSAIPYACIVCAFVFVYLCSFDYVHEHLHI